MAKSKEYKLFKEKYQRFTWSSPFGYDFESVEEALAGYDQTILEAKGVIEQKDEEIAEKDQEIIRLQQELTQCQQMLTEIQIPLPEVAGKSSAEVLNDFVGEEAFAEDGTTAEDAEKESLKVLLDSGGTEDKPKKQAEETPENAKAKPKLPPLIG